MTEPPRGIPEMPPLLEAVAALDIDIFGIVEQDMYPCSPDAPLPIAQRTQKYLDRAVCRPSVSADSLSLQLISPRTISRSTP